MLLCIGMVVWNVAMFCNATCALLVCVPYMASPIMFVDYVGKQIQPFLMSKQKEKFFKLLQKVIIH